MSDPAAMQKQIDDLEFENAEYRRILFGPVPHLPLGVHVSPSEERVLRVMAAHEIATKDMIALALWGVIDYDNRDWKGIHVLICALRQRLKPLGAMITTVDRDGYSLDKEWRDKIMGRAA